MKICKVRDVKTPIKGTAGSAGIDFYVPNDFMKNANGLKTLSPGDDVVIPSGIKVELPSSFALVAFNKSGVSLNKKLQVGACIIDSDYQGEIHLHVFNIGTSFASIKAGEKLVQFLLLSVLDEEIEEVLPECIHIKKTKRADSKFGSTNE